MQRSVRKKKKTGTPRTLFGFGVHTRCYEWPDGRRGEPAGRLDHALRARAGRERPPWRQVDRVARRVRGVGGRA